mmetsp:Transcript_6885/g.10076  ORF Transcript_6885/g.10076 Transcript_6885/m.10076 type:complete len:333 (+) Transcript_6885:70-1068(+)
MDIGTYQSEGYQQIGEDTPTETQKEGNQIIDLDGPEVDTEDVTLKDSSRNDSWDNNDTAAMNDTRMQMFTFKKANYSEKIEKQWEHQSQYLVDSLKHVRPSLYFFEYSKVVVSNQRLLLHSEVKKDSLKGSSSLSSLDHDVHTNCIPFSNIINMKIKRETEVVSFSFLLPLIILLSHFLNLIRTSSTVSDSILSRYSVPLYFCSVLFRDALLIFTIIFLFFRLNHYPKLSVLIPILCYFINIVLYVPNMVAIGLLSTSNIYSGPYYLGWYCFNFILITILNVIPLFLWHRSKRSFVSLQIFTEDQLQPSSVPIDSTSTGYDIMNVLFNKISS